MGADAGITAAPMFPRPEPASGAAHVVVGQILTAHGVRGEVKVRSFSDFAERFAVGKQCLVAKAPFTLTITASRPFRDALLVRFDEVPDRTTAESLRGSTLAIPESEMGELAPHSYWQHDIIGLSVETEAGQKLGRVSQVLRTGANDVFEVAPVPALGGDEAFLLPAVAAVIRQVDIPAERLVVRLPPGLLEAEAQGDGF